jgi:UDP-N-acetylmuramyl pentapeptide phosphotransferase/UDP-N-acetylglucosamine-1-phosphate transferase
MQNGARFFAYSTWVIMISLAIIIFTHQFFQFMTVSLTVAMIIIVSFGYLYFNLAYAATKRFIKKVPAPTNLHMLLGIMIFLPPAAWILIVNVPFTQYDMLLLLFLILGIVAGSVYGNRAGIKARYEYVQKLKEYQKRAAEK